MANSKWIERKDKNLESNPHPAKKEKNPKTNKKNPKK